jgi:hypothetical protein
MATCGKVVRIANKHNVVTIKADCIGIGAGVVARLKELKSEGVLHADVIGYNVAEKSNNPEMFAIKRDEVAYSLADRFKDGQIDLTQILGNEELFAQLVSIKRDKPTSRGQLKVESKDAMASRGQHSPDRADSLALAFAVVPSNNVGVYIEDNE